ncbi:MAG TPA: hypothetical protein VND65_14270 [Candidatus Binatia bacterium]|nr:hypothetical protein [Candidatus Binatia bacterium]
MSTRSSIWYGKDEETGSIVHIYWELAECEIENDQMTGAPIYIAAESEKTREEIAIRLPKEIAMKLLMVLSPTWARDVKQVL